MFWSYRASDDPKFHYGMNILKIFIAITLSFFIGIGITPTITHYLYKYKLWKKKARKVTTDGREASIFYELHKKREVGTPRMGGIVIWLSTLLTVLALALIAEWAPSDVSEKLNFLSRNQTWLPLFTLIAASLVGLVDDLLEVTELGTYFAGGLSLSFRILVIIAIGIIGGLWFFQKLGVTELFVPFIGPLEIGWLVVPLFTIVMLAIYSGSVIDGIDGLAGGVLASMYAAYAGIAFFQGYIDVATLSAALVGGILAFLWFNIPPARFYMGETGMMGLTTAITVIAFLTDSVFVLPIIAFPLIATSASDIIQLLSKKFRNGKKVFLVAPLHHHFEAIGWPSYKVTMRYWIISIVFAVMGMVVAVFL